MAQENRLKYYISFEADTRKAKSQIDDMMRSLEHLNSPQKLKSELPINKELLEAHNNVAKLQGLLNNAINVDTGRLDLSKLNRSLKESGVSLSTFRRSFDDLGEAGVTAFTKIVENVQKGEIPLKRQNALFDKMAETMRNTVRWQISATALNAFTSAIQNAYRYAEDLNRSLNDIRIVTGQSVEQMDAFATKANKAARELSVSTKAYADAALIFYQQGLDDNEVLERTNAVMKMSNVTGETASDVSSYMTAIWNNFEDGSKSLEYYGDVITKLGAATAASSEEIAGGLEKFAAVADTVGLSYEYASAALATIIDRTRQSEDVVGTSLRTIFARLSSLSLGETLEDGVDLTKYSKALDTVGVKVLDQNNQLKDMDTILDELGAKWGGLNDAQKQALATTVAGVRQYSQLIALMDNYDLFKVNVDLAIDSEGTLTEQSKIFEESWLGAKKRVTAALEGIYNQLLDDKIFIFFTNGLASILEIIDWVIERAGGLPAALSLGAIAIQRIFGKTIADLFNDLSFQIDGFTGKTKRESIDLMRQITQELSKMSSEAALNQNSYNEALIQTAQVYGEVLLKAENLTEVQKEQIKYMMTLTQNASKTVGLAQQDVVKKTEEQAKIFTDVKRGGKFGGLPASVIANYKNKENIDEVLGSDGLFKREAELKKFLKLKQNQPIALELDFDLETSLSKKGTKEKLRQKVEESLSNPKFQRLLAKKQLNYSGDAELLENYYAAIEERKTAEETEKQAKDFSKKAQAEWLESSLKNTAEDDFWTETDSIKTQEAVKKAQEAEKMVEEAKDNVKQASLDYSNSVKKDFIEATEKAFTGTFQFISGVSALSAAFKTLGDDSLTVGQRVGNFLTSFTLGAPQFIAGAKNIVSAGEEIKKVFTNPALMGALTEAFPNSIGKIAKGATTLKALLMSWAPQILAITAGITALVAILKAWEEQKPETAIKRAEEATQKAKKAAAEAKQEYLELKNTLDGFTDQYNAIEDMVIGTEEWAAAVSEVNDNLQEVIDKYGLILDEDFKIKNGMIVLTAAGEDKVLKESKKAVDNANLKQREAEYKEFNTKQDINSKIFEDSAEQFANKAAKNLGLDGISTDIYSDKLQKTIIDYFETNDLNSLNQNSLLKELNSQGFSFTGDQINSIFNEGRENAVYSSNFAKTFFMDEVSSYVPQKYRDAGLETEAIAAASQIALEEGNLYTGGPLSGHAGLELITGGETHLAKDGSNAIYQVYDASTGKYLYLSYDEALSFMHQEEDSYFKNLFNNTEKIDNQIDKDKRNYKLRPEEAEEDFENLRQQRVENRKAKSEIDDKELNQYINYLDEFIVGTNEAKEAFTDEMLKELAVANMRFNKGMEDLLDNWTDYKQILNETHQGTEEYAETLNKMKQTMAEIAGVDASDISEAFLLNTENQELLDKAYLGNLEAIYELRKNLAADFADDIGILNDDLSDAINLLDMANTDIEVGMTFDDAAVKEVYGRIITIIQELMRVGDLTGEQAQKLLNTIGLAGKIKMVEVEAKDVNRLTNTTVIDGKEYTVTSDLTSEGKYHIPMLDENSLVVDKIQMNSANTQKAAGNASSRRKDMKKADEEIERYHLIKETIEDLNRELDRLGKEKDRAWGNAHLQYIDREIAKTEEAIDAQKEYLRQIEENYGKDRGKLAGYGGQFDENGRLTNYEELMRAQIAKYNAAVQSGSETQQEAAEEQFNNFKKALEQYEETADLFESEYEQLLDLQNQYYDKLLERIQYKVEIDVQISEEADKYYDYILDMLEDKAYSAAEAITYLGKKTDESLKRIASYQEALNSMFEMHGFGDDAYERFVNGELSIEELATAGFTSQEIDMLIKYRGALMEENKQLMEMRDQVMSSLTDTFDEYMDTLDKMIDKFDHLNAVTSAYKNIVDIVGKKALGISNDMLRAMDEATVATAENTVKASKDRLDAAEAAMADMAKLEEDYQEAMANANKATSEDEKLYWLGEAKGISDAMEHIEEESRAAKEAFLGSWEEALTTAREVFENNVQLAMEEFEDAVSGIYGSLDAMKEAYDQNKVLREQYLEEYERIYELNKLNRDITNSMDDIDSIAAKQTLRDLQEEINELQWSGAQISKYDLDMLRMRYELRLAEIALEDAQNAKSQVRMSRDNDGNWSYVYTADEATVADAAQTYEDKMFQMQQTSNDYLNQISEQWIATTIEMEQAYQKIYEDRTLSDEERMAAIDRLTEYYDSRFLYFNDQITNALGNNQILYEEDWAAWANKNNIQIESNDSFLTNFGDTVLGLTTGFETIDGLHQQLLTAVGSPDGGGYLGELDKSYTDWQEDVDRIMEAAGTSAENFGEDFAKVAEDTVQESENIADEVNDMAGQMEDAFSDVVDAVQDWRDEYSNAIADNISANSRMIQSLGALLTRINQTIDAQIELNRLTGEGATSRSGGSGGGDKDAGKSGDVEPNKTNSRKKRYRIWEWSADGSHQNIIQEIVNISEEDFLKIWNRDYADKPWKYDYTEFNTGGYTGAWGSDGRLAMLHEKELVLNKDDTANFLSAINIVRDIVKVVDMNAAISGMGIGALAAGGIAGAGSTIEQSVTIYADFPNATDHSEIELALANLMNSASQYANRKG